MNVWHNSGSKKLTKVMKFGGLRGPFGVVLGVLWEAPGVSLGPSGASWGPSWGVLGLLLSIWGSPGPLLASFYGFWDTPGPLFGFSGLFSYFQGPPEAFWTLSEALFQLSS